MSRKYRREVKKIRAAMVTNPDWMRGYVRGDKSAGDLAWDCDVPLASMRKFLDRKAVRRKAVKVVKYG